MPDLGSSSLHQSAVLWASDGSTNDKGRQTVGAATDISCRWQEEVHEVVGPDGEPQQATHKVFINQDITLGSIMRQGTVATLPTPLTNLFKVIGYGESPDIRGRDPVRYVSLAAHNNRLPT